MLTIIDRVKKECSAGKRSLEQYTLEDELFRIGLVLPVIILPAVFCVYAFRSFFPVIPCLFTTFLGIYCPGCGGTRALSALLHGHFLKSVWYHPLVPYGVFLYLGFMLTQGLHRLGVKKIRPWKFHNRYLGIGSGILIGNFIIKNILRLGFGVLME